MHGRMRAGSARPASRRAQRAPSGAAACSSSAADWANNRPAPIANCCCQVAKCNAARHSVRLCPPAPGGHAFKVICALLAALTGATVTHKHQLEAWHASGGFLAWQSLDMAGNARGGGAIKLRSPQTRPGASTRAITSRTAE